MAVKNISSKKWLAQYYLSSYLFMLYNANTDRYGHAYIFNGELYVSLTSEIWNMKVDM